MSHGRHSPSHSHPAAVPVTALKGIGPRLAERLAALDIRNAQDLLFHLPFRYEDRTRVVPIGSLRPGTRAVVRGEIRLSEIKYGRRRMLLARISDGTGSLTLRFFHFNASQSKTLARGALVRCYGEARPGGTGLEMVHPEYSIVSANEPASVQAHLTPVYPATEGVRQLTLRRLIEQALRRFESGEWTIADWLGESTAIGFPSLRESLLFLHRPPADASLAALEEGRHPTQRRLALEELTAHQLSMRRVRSRVQAQGAPPIRASGRLVERFLGHLPFALTAAQARVTREVSADLARDVPMLRLVQGDVGSGKTVIAAIAALTAVEAGCQTAVMAPTELLSEQHYRKFLDWVGPLDVPVEWLSGRLKGAAREQALERIASGASPVVVGTHALFQADVDFANLGLTVIDEQHRFGVHQRLALREKGGGAVRPHQLIMTATPIPRTLAMAAYADLDCSVVDELPPGRQSIETVVVPDSRRAEVVRRVREVCADGRQTYWVCTLIEESESLQAQAAEDTKALLAEALPGLRVGLVHGRMKAREKTGVMSDFVAGEVDLLVATTVIEVGVDVPNASLMIIENAERLGLAQLHQLRGRVGRGHEKSTCVLMYHGALSETARFRLAAMRESSDGFYLAQKDLELRGPGELMGTRQTGLLQFRIADLQRDRDLLEQAAGLAERVDREFPESAQPLVERWLGRAERYGDV